MESFEALRNVGVKFVKNLSSYNNEYNVFCAFQILIAILCSESEGRWE